MPFVIKEHHPVRSRLAIALLVLLWAGSGYFLYWYGWKDANQSCDQAVEKQKKLQTELEELKTTRRKLQAEARVLARSAQVDRAAKINIAQSLKELQAEVAELREDVSFYKGIVSPAEGKIGLDIYSFRAMPAGDGLYHYNLVLIQAGKNDKLVSGQVAITLEGIEGGEEVTIPMSRIMVGGTHPITYKFRYFETLSGSFRLPEEYHPRRVIVKLLPGKWRKIDKPVRVFDWHEVKQ